MDYILSFLNYLEFEKRYSKRTIESYNIDLQQFIEYCTENNIQPIEILPKQVRGWVVMLLNNKCENRTVNRKISALKSFYKFQIRQGVLQTNPLLKVDSLKIRKSLPVFVTESNTNQLLDTVEFSNDFEGYRDKLIIQLFYHTGIRLSELINIKNVDIDFTTLSLKVLGKRNKERILPITFYLRDAVQQYNKFKDEKFPSPNTSFLLVTNKGEKMYEGFVYRKVKTALSAVTSIKKRSPHVMRHTFATHMLNNGADINAIKELLGHTSLAATQIYSHNSFEKLKIIYKQAHPRA